MPAENRVVLAVACEDRGHFDAVSRLTDRKIQEEEPWTRDLLDDLRLWFGDGERSWTSITAARRAARDLGRRTHGHFGGAAGGPEAKRCRAQLFQWMEHRRRGGRLDAGILARDLDHRADRLQEMKLAVESGTWPFAVLVVWCQPEVEGWAIGCFAPVDNAEDRRLAQVRRRLSFCPVTEPERMTSAASDSQRDAKKIADELFAGDDERRRRWLTLPLAQLRDRGEKTGLADFLRQVDEKIVPLFSKISRPERLVDGV